MDFRQVISEYVEQPISRQLLLNVLKDYKRPYDKINELVKQGMLVPVKRGIYIPGQTLAIERPTSFLLANHLLGPSYISMETALAHWGLIPERVYEITSATTRKNKTYKTGVGRYSYVHVPVPYYSFGIRQVELTKKQTVLMASPEKALCDKIITTSGILLRSVKQVRMFLTEDLRMDEQQLRSLHIAEIDTWINDAPKRNSLTMLVKTLYTL